MDIALKQRLISHVPGPERVRFGRTLASLEAHHHSELHAALGASLQAEKALALCRAEAAATTHASAAKEAKAKCALEEQRSTNARQHVLLEQAVWKAQQCTDLSSAPPVSPTRPRRPRLPLLPRRRTACAGGDSCRNEQSSRRTGCPRAGAASARVGTPAGIEPETPMTSLSRPPPPELDLVELDRGWHHLDGRHTLRREPS